MSSLPSFSLACRRHRPNEFHPWTLPCFRFAFRCCCCCYWSDHYRYLPNVSSFPQLDLKEQKQNVPISLVCHKSLLSWNACVKFEERLRKVDERVKFMWTSNFQMQLLCKKKTPIGPFKADPIFSSMLLWIIYRDKLEMLTDDVYLFLKLSLDDTWQIRTRCHTASLLSLCCHGPFKRITLQ